VDLRSYVEPAIRQTPAPSFDHLVGAAEQTGREVEPRALAAFIFTAIRICLVPAGEIGRGFRPSAPRGGPANPALLKRSKALPNARRRPKRLVELWRPRQFEELKAMTIAMSASAGAPHN
jgi:hypothetical protein